jgi:hypothetical protein
MDTSKNVELVIVYEGNGTPVSVHFPLAPMHVRLIERAARQGLPGVPDVLRDELQPALEWLDRAAVCVRA